jgi:UDP-glucuronate 4-epimerase
MRILLTGAAGFIGFHVAKRLLERGDEVVGVDNFNSYYDPALKEARVEILKKLGPGLHRGDMSLEEREGRSPHHEKLDPRGEKLDPRLRGGDRARGGDSKLDPRLRGDDMARGGDSKLDPRLRGDDKDKHPHPFVIVRADLADRDAINKLFTGARYDAVVNLAAQAGVRYSLENPYAYIDANVIGFMNILEGVRHHGTGHLVYASTSSVYGLNPNLPYKEADDTNHPVSLYAATKKANEVMAHSYAHLFKIPATGLRFFTVYGPWGRPDMALFKFTKGILEGTPIPVFNEGKMVRDFTYVDDIVEGVVRTIDRPQGYRIFNIGNHHRVELMEYIRAIEKAAGKKAKLELLPMQAGDVAATEADTSALASATGFNPNTPVEVGVQRFVDWYREYYRQ